jgi:hypothetical protein
MKKQTLILVGVLSLLMAAGSAVAQTIDVRGDVPFNFIVGKQMLSAGEYELSSLGRGDGKTLLIRDSDGKPVTMVNSIRAESVQASDKTKLVFNRYGDHYFLAQVWIEGEKAARQFSKSPREKEMASNYSSDRVIVLARLR